jgi:hypothetical protein
MLNLEYLTDPTGQTKAVVIPIAIWRQIFPQATFPQPEVPSDPEALTTAIEDYCLRQAMTEAAQTPLLDRSAAIAYLAE